MPNFSNYAAVMKLLENVQSDEKDMRDQVREQRVFLTKKDGQWDQDAINRTKGKPRYTFNMTSPIIDQIAGDIRDTEFTGKITPAGGDATDEDAELRHGIIRGIQARSKAKHIYSRAGRMVAASGFDAWYLTTEFVDDDSFNQDIVIKSIFNASDRVWIDPGSQEEDRSDATYGFLLSAMPKAQFKEKFPNRTPSSVSDGSDNNVYCNVPDQVIIGHAFYQKITQRELVETRLGKIYDTTDPNYIKIKDEIANSDDPVKRTRMRPKSTFFMRKFDGGGWLAEEEETPFRTIPLVTCYGNLEIFENKWIYYGATLHLMDPQRVYNYTKSREVEEGALSPREKIWMTKKMAKGHTDDLATLNTNAKPVQFFTPDKALPNGPFKIAASQINPGLSVVGVDMKTLMGETAGIFAAGRGDVQTFAQSGAAIEKLQNKSNNVSGKFFTPIEIAVCYTWRLANDALFTVYDSPRMINSMREDGSFKMVQLFDEKREKDEKTGEEKIVFDRQTQKPIVVNDLSKGRFNVTCIAGPSYDSRQSEGLDKMLKLAPLIPGLMEMGGDIALNNVNDPGFGDIADRVREQMFNNGVIPESQMTDEELEKVEELKKLPPKEDPNLVLAQAEQTKADAEMGKVQVAAQRNEVTMLIAQQKMNVDIAKLEQSARKLELDARERELDFQERVAKFDQATQKQQFDQAMATREFQRSVDNDTIANLKSQVESLKGIREGMGVDTFTGPGTTAAFINQSREVIKAQSKVK